MTLQFYLGRTGTGKTFQMIEEMKLELQSAPLGDPIIYIVPDQMSFQAESELIASPKLPGMMRAQVYSFSRLAWLVLGQTGGITRTHINKVGAHMMLRQILDEKKAQLQIYQNAADKTGFIENLEQLFTEYKRYDITHDALSLLSLNEPTSTLRAKLSDMSEIYETYVMRLSGHYLDGEDHFRLLAEKIPQSHYLRGATIYIDGFHGFTPLEKNIIEQLLLHCQKVTVALTLDKPYKKASPEPHQFFRMTGDTYYQLSQLARLHQIEEVPALLFHENQRATGNPSLHHLERYFTKRPAAKFTEKAAVTVLSAHSRRVEIETVAQQILTLVRGGHRYRDIVVLMRNSDAYSTLIQTVFKDVDIPYFIDQKGPMNHHPLIEFVQAVLGIVETDYAFDPMFRALKTDLFAGDVSDLPIYRERISRMENYVLSRGIRGKQWGSEWTFKVQKMMEPWHSVQTDKEIAVQTELNQLRASIFRPLNKLVTALKVGTTTTDFVTAMVQLLMDCQIDKQLDQAILRDEAAGDLARAREHKQAWSGLIGLFDQLVDICGDEKHQFQAFKKMVESGLDALKFSHLPPSLDQVIVGNLDSSKPQNVQFAFIIGLNEGVLPKRMSESGVLTEEDRSKIAQAGVRLAPSAEVQLYDEDFVAYMTFTLAKKHTFFSYPIADDEGKSLLASSYIKRIKEMFPQAEALYASTDFASDHEPMQLKTVTHTNATLKYLTKQLQRVKNHESISPLWWDVYNHYMHDPSKKDAAVFVLSSLFHQNVSEPLSPDVVEQMYTNTISGSVSQIEMFNRCPFSYFSKYGLQLKERPVYQFDAPQLGTFFHESIKTVADELTVNGLSWKELNHDYCEYLAERAAEKIAPFLQNKLLFSSERMRFLKYKFTEVIKKTTVAISQQSKESEFTPVGFEIPFGTTDALIPPMIIPLDNGKQMALNGRIDRVDYLADQQTGQGFLSVIDYKSRGMALNYAEIYAGISMQLLTYLGVVVKHSDKLVMPGMAPAGALYFHMHNPMIAEQSTPLDPSALERTWMKDFKMSGLLLSDLEVLQKMDTGLSGQSHSDILPVAFKKDGGHSSHSKVATSEQISLLMKHTEHIYQRSGNQILAGHTEINPYQMKNRNNCTFCDYKTICQFDRALPENQFRELEPLTLEKTTEKIAAESINSTKTKEH